MKYAKVISLVGLTLVVAIGLIMTGCAQKKSTSVAKPGKPIASLQSIYFDFDVSNIRSNQRSAVRGNAAWLKQNQRAKIVIAGNCDDRGSEEYNIALGQRRANSLRNYLVSSGVSASRVRTISYGEERPTCAAQTEGCWAKNRRGDFTKK